MIALAPAARMFVGYLYPYYALDWMPADEARPPPRTVLVDLACKALMDHRISAIRRG